MTRRTWCRTARIRSMVIGIAAVTTVFAATPARAQYPQRRYQPQSATLSPYLNLVRVNPSGLPNYYSLVRPQLEFDTFRRQQTIVGRQQQLELQTLQSDVAATERLIRPTGKHARFLDTGSTAGFMSQSHYFPTPNHRRPVARR